MYKNSYAVLIFLIIIGSSSCKKSDYLNAKPNEKLVLPETLSDYQAILDNEDVMNGSNRVGGILPDFLEAGTDDYYAISSITSRPNFEQNLYIWNDDIYSDYFVDNWNLGYRCVFYANVVLDGISELKSTANERTVYNNLKGSSLFYRSNAFFHLAQVFAPPFDSSTADTDFGLPLRLTSDLNERIERISVQQTYDKIISDLKEAISLLPSTPLYKTRPSKPAVYGLLARVYLSMRDYDNSLKYADSSLQLASVLLDYNQYNPANMYPFPRFNDEVIFQAICMRNPTTLPGIARVDSTLFAMYKNDDLRKALFFKENPSTGGHYFRGGYDGSFYIFSGLTVGEMFLIRAECNARKNNVAQSMNDLNTLMIKRWSNTVSYPTFTAIDASDALNKILAERRKELTFRGTRWTDLRRLNKEGYDITITRVVSGQIYTLQPNGLKYTYLIPPDVMGFNSDMPQNPR